MSASLLWVDLEMTGLEPETDRIIEFAAIATDWQLREIATIKGIVAQPQAVVDQMVDEVVKMHTDSGLIDKIAEGIDEADAEQQLLRFIEAHFEDDVYLAGNSIHQDRRFIRKYWLELDRKLHYRMLDVSAWKLVMRERFNVKFAKPEAHRALEDIRGSIEELQLYLNKMSD
jgi:oligoribonuclease